VYLDTAGDGVEWLSQQHKNNLTQEELTQVIHSDMRSRYTIFNLIFWLGAPFGLLKVFLGGDPSQYAAPRNTYNEYVHWYRMARTWTTQYFSLRQEDVDVYSKGLIKPGYLGPYTDQLDIPLLYISTAQAKPVFCAARNLALNSSQCEDAYEDMQFQDQSKAAVANASSTDVTLTKCTEQNCSLAMPYRMPSFTASTVLNWWAASKNTSANLQFLV
jgi:hypothetical protein